MSDEIQLIVGLGNPGPEYETTRHNAGAWFVQHLANKYNVPFRTHTKFKGLVTKIAFQDHLCHCLLPTTFMNHSGLSVRSMLDFYKLTPKNLLVVHDELDLKPGATRLKLDGGHGGHNGLRDIIAELGTREFYRLRIGIGHPGDPHEVTHYVLHRPTATEEHMILESIARGLKAIPMLAAGEEQKAMKFLNTDV